jgi:hypothetical protein
MAATPYLAQILDDAKTGRLPFRVVDVDKNGDSVRTYAGNDGLEALA